ncbi:hypothetical protein [Ensifer sp. SSB1]|jgi:hypothetical protein|uniref:hypothetical protein n=1 Tax=Ensifer sp. SSB1 TaxID=2795385 RepID=UPI001A5DEA96|nr:hypothetical protein [Ensifer sp. SSB1]MBK5565900.1 hypothetical protein [Ensifer sp. SSB1]
MTDADTVVAEGEGIEINQPISVKDFLEKTHPSAQKSVFDLWELEGGVGTSRRRKPVYPDIRLHCRVCEGERTFRCATTSNSISWDFRITSAHPIYRCGDCLEETKQYSLRITFADEGDGQLYKYGEYPPFGIPVSNRVLRLFGKVDAELFLKGRQCENLGYGIAAFAYYRRVVENHRNDLFDEIIKVCQTVGASAELIEELKAAKKEISFSKSMEKIKTGLPQGLLIDGHNPLNALHGALSVGLHGESDEDCLSNAQAVRLVLSDLIERIALLKQENKQLSVAVQRLLAKRA